MRKHLNVHDVTPQQTYKCGFKDCGLVCTTHQSLQLHLQNHINTNMRKFVCKTCDTVFNSERSLRVHQYLHVDESL